MQGYMMRKLMEDLFGGKTKNEEELSQIQLELSKLRLEQAKDPHTLSTIDKRLDAMASQYDLTVSSGIENAVNTIGTAIKAGKFGSNKDNIQYAEDYKSGLVKSSTLTSDIMKHKRDLSTNTNFSNIDKILKEAFIKGTGAESIEYLENFVYDLTVPRDRLEQLGQLNPAIDNRYKNSIAKIDNAIKEFGGDGLTQKELQRINSGTYATIKQAEANLEQEFIAIDKIREFKSPTTKDDLLLKSLQKIHTAINDYDDYSAQQGNKLQYAGMMQSGVAGTPSPEVQSLADDLANLEIFRDDRVLKQYAESYQKSFDLYVKNREANKGKFDLSDFREIMDSSLHEQLYTFKTSYNTGGKKNNNNLSGQFNPYPPKKATEKKLISNMFSNRNIRFLNDIVDSNGKIWAQKDKLVQGMGAPSKDSWKIKSIDRTDTGELNRIVLEIPNYESAKYVAPMMGLAPAQTVLAPTATKTITLSPDDFIIEDDLNLSGPGYKSGGRWGLTSYNIFNNLYELVE